MGAHSKRRDQGDTEPETSCPVVYCLLEHTSKTTRVSVKQKDPMITTVRQNLRISMRSNMQRTSRRYSDFHPYVETYCTRIRSQVQLYSAVGARLKNKYISAFPIERLLSTITGFCHLRTPSAQGHQNCSWMGKTRSCYYLTLTQFVVHYMAQPHLGHFPLIQLSRTHKSIEDC